MWAEGKISICEQGGAEAGSSRMSGIWIELQEEGRGEAPGLEGQ